MMGPEYQKVPTVRVRRHRGAASLRRGEKLQYGYTRIKISWPSYSLRSNWYFKGEDDRKVYLKIGRNTVGKDCTNHIRIMSAKVSSPCDLAIDVPRNGSAPVIRNMGSYCYYNGMLMGTACEVEYKRVVALFSGGIVLLFQFYRDLW